MARPKKQTVDYFPHIAKSGKTILMLESRWGNNGYAFWFKLLEILCQSDGHVSDYGNPLDKEFLLAKTHVNDETATEILNKLAETGKIDQELWSEGLIWCQSLVDNIKDAYKKRINDLPEKPVSAGRNHHKTEFPAEETPSKRVSGDGSTESKVKKIRVNKNNIYTTEFENFYSLYPRPENKSQTFANWKAKLKAGLIVDQIMQAVKNYKLKCTTEKIEKTYCYSSSNFLGKKSYIDDYLPDRFDATKLIVPNEKQKGVSWKPPPPTPDLGCKLCRGTGIARMVATSGDTREYTCDCVTKKMNQ